MRAAARRRIKAQDFGSSLCRLESGPQRQRDHTVVTFVCSVHTGKTTIFWRNIVFSKDAHRSPLLSGGASDSLAFFEPVVFVAVLSVIYRELSHGCSRQSHGCRRVAVVHTPWSFPNCGLRVVRQGAMKNESRHNLSSHMRSRQNFLSNPVLPHYWRIKQLSLPSVCQAQPVR